MNSYQGTVRNTIIPQLLGGLYWLELFSLALFVPQSGLFKYESFVEQQIRLVLYYLSTLSVGQQFNKTVKPLYTWSNVQSLENCMSKRDLWPHWHLLVWFDFAFFCFVLCLFREWVEHLLRVCVYISAVCSRQCGWYISKIVYISARQTGATWMKSNQKRCAFSLAIFYLFGAVFVVVVVTEISWLNWWYYYPAKRKETTPKTQMIKIKTRKIFSASNHHDGSRDEWCGGDYNPPLAAGQHRDAIHSTQ